MLGALAVAVAAAVVGLTPGPGLMAATAQGTDPASVLPPGYTVNGVTAHFQSNSDPPQWQGTPTRLMPNIDTTWGASDSGPFGLQFSFNAT